VDNSVYVVVDRKTGLYLISPRDRIWTEDKKKAWLCTIVAAEMVVALIALNDGKTVDFEERNDV
jgi:hypothetical protein